MRTTYLVSVVFFAFLTSSVRAESLPTFWPAVCSYGATHIVVATTEPRGGGRFKVTESWKGDLKPGEALTVSGLAEDAKGDMVLFMARNPDPKSTDRWKPVGIGEEWRVSVVWFDGEIVSAVQQRVNPGPAVVLPFYSINSRKDFKQLVDHFLGTERALATARVIEDRVERAAAFAKIVNGRYDRKEEAFAELGKCGPPALPALRAYLKGPPDYNLSYGVKALATAGGKDVVPELHAMLEEELAYWKKVGPTLREHWWQDNGTNNEPCNGQASCGILSLSMRCIQPQPTGRRCLTFATTSGHCPQSTRTARLGTCPITAT